MKKNYICIEDYPNSTITKNTVVLVEETTSPYMTSYKVANGKDYYYVTSNALNKYFKSLDDKVESIPNDDVDHPSHYADKIECIDAMLQQFGKEAVKIFCKLNSFKYLWRCDKKHSSAEKDIRKAAWYCKKYIELSDN